MNLAGLYRKPFQVYLVLGALALAGLAAAWTLPISLFPNSTKPSIEITIPYGGMNAEEFLARHGRRIEARLQSLAEPGVEVDHVTATYDRQSASLVVDFKWGTAPTPAARAIETVIHAEGASLPREVRDGIESWTRNEASFFAITLYSDRRSPDELYSLLDPLITPKLSGIRDAEKPVLFNPMKREIAIELNPRSMAQLQILPRDIEAAVTAALSGQRGGSLVSPQKTRAIELPKAASTLEELSSVPVQTLTGQSVHLSDVAAVRLAPAVGQSRIYRTNGAPSLFLYASPRPGGNVKRMCDQMRALVEELLPLLPSDVKYRVIVDPSEFISGAVSNVLREVALGALLAVLVLYLFIGSFRNTLTAAIEIPLSIVLAFILMRLTGMNLNLISLGGLALSSGMNVDASVVVLENIFRHLEGAPDSEPRLAVIVRAVREVTFPIIASTLTSIVVFVPLAFTSDLTNAVLGDLARAVVFSHGLSAVVALILVPTVRVQLATRLESHRAPLSDWLARLEDGYAALLRAFLTRPKALELASGGLLAVLLLLCALVLPRLERQLLATPDTDWVTLGLDVQGNTTTAQMDSVMGTVASRLMRQHGEALRYTFTRVNSPNEAWIMARLRNRSDIRKLRMDLEAEFQNTPSEKYWVSPWNPSELPLPDPPLLRVAVRGGTADSRAEAGRELLEEFRRKDVVSRISSEPDLSPGEEVALKLPPSQWSALRAHAGLTPADLADTMRVLTEGKKITEMQLPTGTFDVTLRNPEGAIPGAAELGAMPIGVAGKLVPLRALAQIRVQAVSPAVYREDGREALLLTGRNSTGQESRNALSLRRAEETLAEWSARRSPAESGAASAVTARLEDSQRDLTQALSELKITATLSIALMLVTLILQFGGVADALLVMVSVPLGLIGVILSLWIFRSTLSLNSVLGTLLLNGIAVANSIMLVDALKRALARGLDPVSAAVEAGRSRLRPILITCCTTVLGMLPIALGLGDGGRILQPLGIAVAGGLWFSTLLTLFIVPGLQLKTAKAA